MRGPAAKVTRASLTAALALEPAPVRVNLVAPGFTATPLSASPLGDGSEAWREQLRAALPFREVVGPDDMATLAVHLMCDEAVTGTTSDLGGGHQLVPS